MVYIREITVEKPLVDQTKKRGGLALKFTSPGRVSVPDRIVLMPGGVVCFVECKAPGQKPTAAQLREHARLRRLGFDVVVIDHQDQITPLLDRLTVDLIEPDYYSPEFHDAVIFVDSGFRNRKAANDENL